MLSGIRGMCMGIYANLLGQEPTSELILHLDEFTLWLPEETWTWELGAYQSIRFTQSSMCSLTCWGEWRQHDEEAIPLRPHNQGMCCKLHCTEQIMMQLWNVKHAHNRKPAVAQHLSRQCGMHGTYADLCTLVCTCIKAYKWESSSTHTHRNTQKKFSLKRCSR